MLHKDGTPVIFKDIVDASIVQERFNSTNPANTKYVAKRKTTPNYKGGLDIIVYLDKISTLNSIESNKLVYNAKLNQRLKDILSSKGISIGALTELERRQGINGVTDFSIAESTANGLIEMVRLAEGIEGEKALPEEFSHFVIEALGDNSVLLNRALTAIRDLNMIPTVLGDEYSVYQSLYNGDINRLSREAIGKLLSSHLNKVEIPNNRSISELLNRLFTWIRNWIKTNIAGTEIQKALVQINKDLNLLASNILSGAIDSQISVKNIVTDERYFNLSERVERDKKLLKDIINNELKRLKIYSTRNEGRKTGFNQEQLLFIDTLERKLETNEEIEGIYSFLESALKNLGSISSKLAKISIDDMATLNQKASTLRDVRNYFFSYNNMISQIREYLRDEERLGEVDNRYGARVRVAVNEAHNLLADVYSDYKKVALPIFAQFLKPFMGNSIEIPFGKYKGRVTTVEDLIKQANEDIGFFDRWLDSMADSSDDILKVMDQAVKKAKEKSRLSSISIAKELAAAHMALEQSGIKNTEWMFERDSNNKVTGNYISNLNYSIYKEAKDSFIKSLETKYGAKEDLSSEKIDEWNSQLRKWIEDNTEVIDQVRKPKYSIYVNKTFLTLNEAQRNYYNAVLTIKENLEQFLPTDEVAINKAVQIRKDTLERVKSADGFKSILDILKQEAKDTFIRRVDETEFGTVTATQDFEGDILSGLPVYFTRRLEDPSDLSLDVTSTMIAYAAMANDYKEMNRVIDVLELGRDILKDRKIIETSGNRPVVERFKVIGRTIENNVLKKDSSYFLSRLNDFFDMQVYGRYMADEGAWGIFDKGKLANFVNRITSMNSLALNALAGISNIATGTVLMRTESIANEFFSMKDVTIADKNYAIFLPAYLSEIGNRIKTSKLALFDEKFNIMQEYEQDMRAVNMDRKTWFSRMFNTSSLFFINNTGEHWMQNRTALALANNYKLKTSNGRVISLWDALETVPIIRNGKKVGAELRIKEGVTKMDGSIFTDEDIYKFSRKSAAINQRLHGIYNKADRNAFQKLAIGRLAMMFRKWMRPSYNRRFSSAKYNYDLEAWTEGYYLTAGKFFVSLGKDLFHLQLHLNSRWDELNKTQRANMRRALSEVTQLLTVTAILSLIEGSKDRERTWKAAMLEYQLRRLQTEVGAMTPSPRMGREIVTLLNSPMAATNTINDLLGLYNLVLPSQWQEELQSGRYKGHSKNYKRLMQSPLLPMNKTIYRVQHPEESIPFFMQQ